MRIAFAVAGLHACLLSWPALAQTRVRWSIPPQPQLVLGRETGAAAELFAQIRGAARLPNGELIVADDGPYWLRRFSPDGRLLGQFGREGQGPGEITRLWRSLRCGDSLFTVERLTHRVSVFGLDGRFVRSFRFGSAKPGETPYVTACNANGVFFHYGYYADTALRAGTFRPSVLFWLTGADSAVRRVIGTFPGPEWHGVIGPRMRGAMTPLIGRRTLIAVAADRLYVGHADNYEIASYDFMGKRIGLIRRAAALVRTSAKDVEYAMALALATVATDQRAEAERELRTHVVPRTLPAYNALVADSEGLLWVQDYPRPDASSTSWSVFTAQGNEVARLSLPTHLEVYEIGRDYVLGRFLDPEESIPQVRIYRLQRPAATR